MPTGVPSITRAMVDARRLRGVTSATIDAAVGVNPASPIPTMRRVAASCTKFAASPVPTVAADQIAVAAAMIRLRHTRSAISPIGSPTVA